MKTAILNEEDQKIIEELAGKFGVSEYDARIDELDKLYCTDRITEEEYVELCSLKVYWSKA